MKWLEKLEEIFIGITLLFVSMVLFTNVILRYVFNASSTWAEELIRYGIIWMTFVGVAVCFRKVMHPGIDVIFTATPKVLHRGIKIFVTLVSIICMGWLTKYGFDLCMFSVQTGQITPALQIKLYWVYASIPVGSLLALVHLARILFGLLKKEKEIEV